MKNFFKVVFSRAVFTGAFIALQFAAVYLLSLIHISEPTRH